MSRLIGITAFIVSYLSFVTPVSADRTLQHSVFAGPQKYNLAEAKAKYRTNSSDLGWMLGYRLIHSSGYGLEISQGWFSTHTRGDYNADIEAKWTQLGIVRRFDWGFDRNTFSMDPSISFAVESAQRDEWEDTLIYGCMGCGDGAMAKRVYLVFGLGAEVCRGPFWDNLWFAIGAFGRGLLSAPEFSTDTSYAPLAYTALGVYLSIEIN